MTIVHAFLQNRHPLKANQFIQTHLKCRSNKELFPDPHTVCSLLSLNPQGILPYS